MATVERTLQEKKLLAAMEDPAGREVIVDLIKYNLANGKLGSVDIELAERSPKAFEAFLDFDSMVREELEVRKKPGESG